MDIRPLIEKLPHQFGIEAESLLDRRRQDVDKKAKQEADRTTA